MCLLAVNITTMPYWERTENTLTTQVHCLWISHLAPRKLNWRTKRKWYCIRSTNAPAVSGTRRWTFAPGANANTSAPVSAAPSTLFAPFHVAPDSVA